MLFGLLLLSFLSAIHASTTINTILQGVTQEPKAGFEFEISPAAYPYRPGVLLFDMPASATGKQCRLHLGPTALYGQVQLHSVSINQRTSQAYRDQHVATFLFMHTGDPRMVYFDYQEQWIFWTCREETRAYEFDRKGPDWFGMVGLRIMVSKRTPGERVQEDELDGEVDAGCESGYDDERVRCEVEMEQEGVATLGRPILAGAIAVALLTAVLVMVQGP
ncbi:hypothetical protein BJ508DRAFT_321292 [Ascobolus immersus RN42]|uniref:Ubiquitin 3 binding protein But2 C-terminal domain-containing protein n=1 Tax=Ascobolus immersus RN42 TaxID=1160509 RepID=A0A3N4ILF2_ASCIM|nr:hypothetical protein BJ508DRAFT_321292 [Ascobolus immersus RN42]